MEFFLRDEPVTTDGSACLYTTDIGDSTEEALVCKSSLNGPNLNSSGAWYLSNTSDRLVDSVAEGDRITGSGGSQGWASDVVTNGSDVLVRLRRVSELAVEGTFTCAIPGDNYSPRDVSIISPSKTDRLIEEQCI